MGLTLSSLLIWGTFFPLLCVSGFDIDLQTLKPYLVKERHNPEWCGSYSDFNGTKLPKYRDNYIYDICFYHISKEVEDFLLESVDRLYKWNPPYLPEDICFWKNGQCHFKSITHEETAYINIKDKKEYEHVTKMGIKLQKEYEGCYSQNSLEKEELDENESKNMKS